jgi:ribosome-associated protein
MNPLTSVGSGELVNERKAPMKIETEFIKLDSFLKAESLASSGGEAKILISEGLVRVNGECETRRGRKLYPGDKVELDGNVFTVE